MFSTDISRAAKTREENQKDATFSLLSFMSPTGEEADSTISYMLAVGRRLWSHSEWTTEGKSST